MDRHLLDVLVCPVTGAAVHRLEPDERDRVNARIRSGEACYVDGTVVEGARATRMGTARVKPRLCVTYETETRQARACRVCVDRCPYPEEAIRILPPAEGEAVGHPEVIADACTGCGLCVFACPTAEPAIIVEPRRD